MPSECHDGLVVLHVDDDSVLSENSPPTSGQRVGERGFSTAGRPDEEPCASRAVDDARGMHVIATSLAKPEDCSRAGEFPSVRRLGLAISLAADQTSVADDEL